ncbi:MAG TPA: flagellar biosynthetic protein FliR [Geminicoccaceae bacterium]|nr:flagellar biosynthetic protein FliR [Geminicoccaceae bacterium]
MLPELVAQEGFALLLIFVRIGSAFMVLPGLAEAYVSPRVRLLLALAVSVVLTGPLGPGLPALPAATLELARLLGGEVLLGLFLGAIARMAFAALHVAGTTLAYQSGLAAAAIFDPNEATQGTLPGNFLTTTALLLLFVTDGHHMLLQALAASYAGLPAGGAPPLGDMAELLARLLDQAFAVALRIAAPLLLVSLLMSLGMGVLNRLMPTFQVFFIALPLQLLAAFATLMLSFAAGLLAFFNLFEDALATLVSGG